jgi:ATP-binding cassette subfamily C protein
MPDGDASLWHMLRFALFGAWGDVARAVGLGMGVALIQLGLYAIIILLFDAFIPLGDGQSTLQLVMLMLVGAGVATSITYQQGRVFIRLQSHIEIRLQSAVWGKLLRLPASFFRGYSTGDLSQRVLSVGNIRTTLLALFISAGVSGMTLVMGVPSLFLYSPILGGAITLFLAGLMGIVLALGRMRGRAERRVGRALGEHQTVMLMLIAGVGAWRMFGVVRQIHAIWMRHFGHLQTATHRATIAGNRLAWLRDIAMLWGALMLIFISAGGGVSVGVFIGLNGVLMTLIGAVLGLGDAIQRFAELLPLHERLHPILSAPREVLPHHHPAPPLTGRIHLEHVRFGYDGGRTPIIPDLSLTIGAGEFVALVGRSGCGKSTLVRLLLGFDAPQAGAIYYDDQPLADLDISTVRGQIGAVLQHQPLISTGNIYEAVAGLTPLPHEAVWDLLRVVALDADIRAMPMGLYTRLNDNALALSAGQRQRLHIARALAHQPRILIFDEATSALDSTTQRIIRHNLDALGITRIVIAHRLSTIAQADNIVVLDAGRIVEHGRYDDLVSAGGLFSQLAGTFL